MPDRNDHTDTGDEPFSSISQYRMLVYGLVLVLVMVLRPEGIMGTSELTKDYIKNIFTRRKKITAPTEVPADVRHA